MNVHLPFAAWFFIPLVIFIRLCAGGLDRDRIRNYIKERGGEVLDISWSPFGRGWFGSKNERIYEVTYRTQGGRRVEATCKTTMLSGVYWTSDTGSDDIHDPDEASAEAIQCPTCGATIPANRSRCPKCGWSYKDR